MRQKRNKSGKQRGLMVENGGGMAIGDVRSAYGGANINTIGVTDVHAGALDIIVLSTAICIGNRSLFYCAVLN